MKTIKRYELDVASEQIVNIPFNSELLTVDVFNKKPCLFVLVDPGGRSMNRKFVIFHEDKEIPMKFNRTGYIGSFVYKAEVGQVMLHVFEDAG